MNHVGKIVLVKSALQHVQIGDISALSETNLGDFFIAHQQFQALQIRSEVVNGHGDARLDEVANDPRANAAQRASHQKMCL